MRMVIGCLVLATLLLGAASVFGPGLQSQEVPPGDVVVRQAELEKLVAKQETVLQDLLKRTKELEERQKGHDAWVRSVPAAITVLKSGVDQAESQGFTRAGANMDARESLLNALRNFGRDITANMPAVVIRAR